MGDKKARGLVLREKKTGESDNLLTILTENGKLQVLAKGTRNLKNHNLSSARPFSFADFTLYEKHGYYWLRETDRISGFFAVSENMDRLAFGQYFLEFADTVAVSDSEEGPLLSLLLNTLYALSTDRAPYEQIKAVFELKAMALSGFEPMLTGCETCGNFSDPLFFFPVDGVLKCGKCFHQPEPIDSGEEQTVFCLPLPVCQAMRYILTADRKQIFDFRLPEDLLAMLGKVCERYAVDQIGKVLPTLRFLHGIQ